MCLLLCAAVARSVSAATVHSGATRGHRPVLCGVPPVAQCGPAASAKPRRPTASVEASCYGLRGR
eukprot:13552000-Alexandrium_andersonii.AAC.1